MGHRKTTIYRVRSDSSGGGIQKIEDISCPSAAKRIRNTDTMYCVPTNIEATLTPSLIILDLGNVLLDLHFERFTRRCAEVSARTEPEIRERYIEGDAKSDFEQGKTTEREFFAEMMDWMRWPPDRLDELKYFWSDIFSEIPGARKALTKLKKASPVWILSDTDPVHIDFIRAKYPWSLAVDRLLTSYGRGITKRAPGSFSPIIQDAQLPPEQILFLDDLQANIDAAKTVGIDARLFTNWGRALSSII